MCDILHENGKCCGACLEEQPEIETVECDICCQRRDKTLITKNYKETGWTVCSDCLDEPEKLYDALIEQTYVRDKKITRLKKEIQQIK